MGTKITATAFATALLGAGLALPAAAGPRPAQDTLQDRVNAVQRTRTVGVQAQQTGPGGTEYATAGQADTSTGEPVRPGQAFRMASTTKTFVATAVLQLAGQGKLSLDDTVERWLPGVVSGNGHDGSKITVRQLLQHTSGVFNYTADFPPLTDKEAFKANRFTTWTAEQLVAIAMRHQPAFPPGTSWGYSNTNYILAGMIIRKATGRTWQEQVTQGIIEPLGLARTTAPSTFPYIPGPHMHGYSDFGVGGEVVDVTDWNPSGGEAAGAMTGTTADLTRFFRALMDGRLLRPAQLAEMKTTVRAEPLDVVWPGARYGLGLLQVPLTCGGSYYGHPGDLSGYTTRNAVSGDGGQAIVVEATGDGTPDDLSTQRALNSLIDKGFCPTDTK
ncbi:serine hydrolase domain-containing protein [Actinomadura rubrisoli]|uniref:Class A beta-lactamase-related serine hydrolase n=1 Tax=Actinomadura rubrisoli TaxID=2530368 RepID=A0A4R5AEC7_9ACTN|nr:serine hydrolase domain-containing protein [Actinomadura rubrisoli]TDD69194.1 class A beta-lactamase-related serine hydrolase [Actinomadura rubrisoli]